NLLSELKNMACPLAPLYTLALPRKLCALLCRFSLNTLLADSTAAKIFLAPYKYPSSAGYIAWRTPAGLFCAARSFFMMACVGPKICVTDLLDMLMEIRLSTFTAYSVWLA